MDIGCDLETGKRKQKTVSGFKTKKEAEKACAEMITKIETGGYIKEIETPTPKGESWLTPVGFL
ncbi:Arm DNA-binding domain-containing protein, partial [Aneurinibacillus aneurinilyticus]|uniref:Arm DNA-binding domain-containing protein n=1 Tax=Aneurinibacillus aneurinilyticus TaxID=1391 RepID=UPI0023F39E72